jgi:hypothetical protein
MKHVSKQYDKVLTFSHKNNIDSRILSPGFCCYRGNRYPYRDNRIIESLRVSQGEGDLGILFGGSIQQGYFLFLQVPVEGVQIPLGVSLHCRPWKKPNLIVDTDVFLFYNSTYE